MIKDNQTSILDYKNVLPSPMEFFSQFQFKSPEKNLISLSVHYFYPNSLTNYWYDKCVIATGFGCIPLGEVPACIIKTEKKFMGFYLDLPYYHKIKRIPDLLIKNIKNLVILDEAEYNLFQRMQILWGLEQ